MFSIPWPRLSRNNRRGAFLVLLLVTLSAVGLWYARGSVASRRDELPATAVKSNEIARNYGELPLSFEKNEGQSAPDVKFLSRGPGYDLFLTASGATINLRRGRPNNAGQSLAGTEQQTEVRSQLYLKLIDAQKEAGVRGDDELPGRVNYFVGNDPSAWHINIPTYRKVRYTGVFPGVDLIYYGNRTQLEYDFVLAPGTNTLR
jgi:hypothetical protein